MNNLPTIADIEGILAEKPEIRAQVSRRGVINSGSLPDALRLKIEAIALRKQLVQNKASIDDYVARKAASAKQLADGKKTLAALRSRKTTAPAKASLTAPVNPFASESTGNIAILLHRGYATDRPAALAELARRGVTYDERSGIYSHSSAGGRAVNQSLKS